MTDLEATFQNVWRLCCPHAPRPVTEHRFHPTRRWRFDFAWPAQMVAVELEGGTFTGGRHTRGKGFEQDCAKYNSAAEMGWLILRYTRGQLDSDPVGCAEQVQRVLEGRA